MAHYEPPHQDLRCLQSQLFSSLVLKELIPCPVTFLHFPSAYSRTAVVTYWRKYVYLVLVNPLGLGLPRERLVWLIDRPDKTIAIYREQQFIKQELTVPKFCMFHTFASALKDIFYWYALTSDSSKDQITI